MKKDVTELKKMFLEILKNPSLAADTQEAFARELKELKPQEHYAGNFGFIRLIQIPTGSDS